MGRSRDEETRTQLVSKLCLLYPFLLINSVAVCRIEWVNAFSFFLLSFQARISHRLLLSSVASTESQLSHMGSSSTSSLPAIILPPSSHPVWPSRFMSGHLLQRTQGDTWLLRQRWVAVSLGLLKTDSWPLHFSPLQLHWGTWAEGRSPNPPPPRAFCCFSVTLIYCSAVRAAGTAGWLPSNSLTLSFTAYIGSAECVCVCVLCQNSAC